MDSKRKSVFSNSPSSYSRETRVKVEHQPSKNITLHKGEAKSHPSTVSQLLDDVIESLRCLRSHTSDISPDIFKAISGLDEVLRRANSPKSDISDYNSHIPIHHSVGTISTENCLPVLPPIMDKALERAVFTHPGVSNNAEATYDRLEILGDAYIELIATKLIWQKFQEIPSGRISQIRELLVKNETLAEYATEYGLDCRAAVPHDYLKQPKRWTKTRADVFEAYVAAAIISDPVGGYEAVEQWLTQLWLPKLSELGPQRPNVNAKEILARKIMGKGIKLKYIDERPPVQQSRGVQTFFIGLYLTGWGWNNKHLGSGQGTNKTIAGNEAARQALLNESLVEEISGVKRAYETRISHHLTEGIN
ncbi:ribonuclease III [Aspergillus alliaceus]|uniref:ribonuclease III n=1 Tax=Petromyces alliaceus TaxID=209559 RepID=UPI0012A5E4AD|nr:ribonuclease III domain-containing protein [Aspergillus alliaceus]KAB8234613.1 ribonuclease III domain-containing protein [Aspergillus alliaceus]